MNLTMDVEMLHYFLNYNGAEFSATADDWLDGAPHLTCLFVTTEDARDGSTGISRASPSSARPSLQDQPSHLELSA